MPKPTTPTLTPYGSQLPDHNNPATWVALTTDFWTWVTGQGYSNQEQVLAYANAVADYMDGALVGDTQTLLDGMNALTGMIEAGEFSIGSAGQGDSYIEFHNNYDGSGSYRFGLSSVTGNWYFRDGGGAVSEVVSTANLRQKLAVSLTGDIGEVATLKNKTGSLVGKGVEVNGTQLAYSGTNSTGAPTEGGAPAGRWSAQSVTQNGGIGTFVRIM